MLGALALAGCATNDEVEAGVGDLPTQATESPVPEPEYIDTFNIGETIELPSATLIVNVLEQRDIVNSSSPDFTPNFVPAAGERIWYFDITWTNNSSEAVTKECHGPYSMDLRAYDIDGNEMLMFDQPGFIVGQNCSTGLLSGQTGTWLSGFRSLDADFGWATFSDYSGGEALVVLDPSLELTKG